MDNQDGGRKTFLEVSGDGSRETVLKSFLEKNSLIKPKEKPRICRVEKSPLLAQLQSFIPALAESNNKLEKMSKNDLEKLNMENVEDNEDSVINLSVVQADDMQDSPVFQALNLSQQLKPEDFLKAFECDSSDDTSDESDLSDSDEQIVETTSKKIL
ncbi:NOP protein chaperone 1 [Hyalella azteca]|uniref:NOP protein chaperone 1 n=1 Tax=Hyalella azteca TaxID=294128 RepID=A0A8B7NE06_HYAAZ|nr:NOP protein chaperone 1 [Hyalella azteca]